MVLKTELRNKRKYTIEAKWGGAKIKQTCLNSKEVIFMQSKTKFKSAQHKITNINNNHGMILLWLTLTVSSIVSISKSAWFPSFGIWSHLEMCVWVTWKAYTEKQMCSKQEVILLGMQDLLSNIFITDLSFYYRTWLGSLGLMIGLYLKKQNKTKTKTKTERQWRRSSCYLESHYQTSIQCMPMYTST